MRAAAAAPDRLEAPPGGEERPLVTPEGVDLRIRLGAVSERTTAFLIDAGLILLSLAAVTIVLALALGALVVAGFRNGAAAPVILWTVGLFAVRNGYFILFELGARGATPGKRIMGLRVAARDGGRLTASMVFGRNVLREVELLLPLSFLAIGAVRPEAAPPALACVAWALGLALLPFLTRDRLRLGDVLAGTFVVKTPKRALRGDAAAAAERASTRIVFSDADLAVYGEKELHVLEEILRRNQGAAVREVADRIRRKIGWRAGPQEHDLDFLDAYYLALRGRLEQGLLYGRRRRSKTDPAPPPPL
jgi:uncharacterized RDD family membrane protein YckC